MVAKFTNNAVGTLALSISDIETSITVSGDEGGRFPVLTEGDYFPATLVDEDGNREIIRVTARVGNTMTVQRGQEGTSARAFAAGSRVSHRLTAESLNEFVEAHETLNEELSDLKADVSGNLETGGSSTAYTLTTNQEFSSLTDGALVSARMHETSGEDPTINVDSLGAKQIRTVSGVNVPDGALAQGAVYTFVYDSTDDAWIVHGRFGDTLTVSNSPDLVAIEELTGTGIPHRTNDEDNEWALDAGVAHLADTTADKLFGTNEEGKSGTIDIANGLELSEGELGLNFSSLAEDTNPDSDDDYIATYDDSDEGSKKIPLGLTPGAIVAIIEDNKASGSAVDSLSSGVDNVRTLNTLVYNRDSLVSLTSNRFTLPAGTWEIEWVAPIFFGNVTRTHQSFLYNQSDSSEVKRGTGGAYSDGDGGDGSTLNSVGSAVVTITSSKAFEIRHRVSGSGTSQGSTTSFGTQVITRVVVRRA